MTESHGGPPSGEWRTPNTGHCTQYTVLVYCTLHCTAYLLGTALAPTSSSQMVSLLSSYGHHRFKKLKMKQYKYHPSFSSHSLPSNGKFHSYSAKFALVPEIAINNSFQMSSSLLSSLDHNTAFTFEKNRTKDTFKALKR